MTFGRNIQNTPE